MRLLGEQGLQTLSAESVNVTAWVLLTAPDFGFDHAGRLEVAQREPQGQH